MEAAFRLFGIPVQVSALFALTVLVLGPRSREPWLVLNAAWLAIAFVGVLLHELGHAFTAKAFGYSPAIRLHAFGGVTSWTGRPLSPGRRVLVGLAGPGVGIVVGLGALLVLLVLNVLKASQVVREIGQLVVWANLGWGILNLLPMMPLDGGAVLAAGFEALWGRRAIRWARILSLVIAGCLFVLLLLVRAFYPAFVCALLAYINYQGLAAETQRRAPPSEPATP